MDALRKTVINVEIQKSFSRAVKERDRDLATVQWAVQYAACPLVQVLNLMEQGHQLPQTTIIDAMVDTRKLLGRASVHSNNFRRELLRPHLQRHFQGVANSDGSTGFNNLLGDDLPGRMKEIAEGRKVMSDVRYFAS